MSADVGLCVQIYMKAFHFAANVQLSPLSRRRKTRACKTLHPRTGCSTSPGSGAKGSGRVSIGRFCSASDSASTGLCHNQPRHVRMNQETKVREDFTLEVSRV